MILSPFIPVRMSFLNEGDPARTWTLALSPATQARRFASRAGATCSVRHIAQFFFGALFVLAFWASSGALMQALFTSELTWDPTWNDLVGPRFHFAVWVAIEFFGIARFFNYIDQRIRLEGWEVELRLRFGGTCFGGLETMVSLMLWLMPRSPGRFRRRTVQPIVWRACGWSVVVILVRRENRRRQTHLAASRPSFSWLDRWFGWVRGLGRLQLGSLHLGELLIIGIVILAALGTPGRSHRALASLSADARQAEAAVPSVATGARIEGLPPVFDPRRMTPGPRPFNGASRVTTPVPSSACSPISSLPCIALRVLRLSDLGERGGNWSGPSMILGSEPPGCDPPTV